MSDSGDINPFWPLPADYPELTTDGKRLARVVAASLRETPDSCVAAWSFFKDYYLTDDPDDQFAAGYYKEYLPSAPLHYSLVRWRHEYTATALAAPRKSAKSTTTLSMVAHELITRPGTTINLIKAKDDFVIDDFECVKYQLEHNARIIDDFGILKPPRGTGLWSNHRLVLTNRASLRGLSVDGKMRGPISDLAILDDIEDDKSNESRNESRLLELKERLLKVIVPMLDVSGHVLLIGTLLSLRSFLYHVCTTTEDPRFRDVERGGRWKRLVVPAQDVSGRNAWRAKFTREYLEEKRALMGDSHFETEYMNNPRAEGAALFTIEPEKHEYTSPAVDPRELEDPFSCPTRVKYYEISREGNTLREVAWKDLVAECYRGITVDYAPTQSPGSDYSCILVWGIDSRNVLWVLDGWYGRVPSPRLAQLAWKYATLWRVHILGVEAVTLQMELYQRIREYGEHISGVQGWCPAVVPVRYPANLSKADRIAGLEWRFNHGLLKLPAHRRTEVLDGRPGIIAELYAQIRAFTPDLRNLPHDDVIDTLAQAQFVTRTTRPSDRPNKRPETVVERLKAGEVFFEDTTIPLAFGLDLSRLTSDDLSAIISQGRGNLQDQGLLAEDSPLDPRDKFNNAEDLQSWSPVNT